VYGAVGQRLLDLGRQAQQPQRIGHRYTALAHPLSHLLLGQAELFHELAVGRGLFQRVQVSALDVLHEGQLQHLLGRGLLDDDRHVHQPGGLGRQPAALAGN
jgi:hypothetical protein